MTQDYNKICSKEQIHWKLKTKTVNANTNDEISLKLSKHLTMFNLHASQARAMIDLTALRLLIDVTERHTLYNALVIEQLDQ